ncbi:MAG: 3-hydroxyacyl-ACP dehydratase FabZ [Geminicoccaceae bacterium]|nr:3-hydroxyacyl-ACP dehydratase FabZ [Geminicoccaceae bacterium]
MLEVSNEPGRALPNVEATDIQRVIPHRFPMLLIDKVVDIVAFESAVGIKAVSIGEPFFAGHFPNDPIMPGVLVVESMAQTAAVLVVASRARIDRGDGVYFMGIDKARFRRPVRPGDLIRLEIRKLALKLGIWRFAGRAVVDGKLVAECEFMAKVIDGRDQAA